MQIDVLIFGGGAAGLWLLDLLSRRGIRGAVLEAHRLGFGQTIAAQGIIHGGLKYTLRGALTPSALRIREMPDFWRVSLSGRGQPDLSRRNFARSHCHLWRTDSLSSRLGMMGAALGLHVAPQVLSASDRPAVLAGCPGPVARLDEPVIAPGSLLETLRAKHRRRILLIDREQVGVEVDTGTFVRAVRLADPASGAGSAWSRRTSC